MSAAERVKRFVLPLRRSRVVRRAYIRLQRNAQGRGRNDGVAASSIERVLSYGVFTAEDRTRSVLDLIELFFDLCELRTIDVFIEAGAKEAAASQRAADIGCRAVAFEANPYTHRRFADTLASTSVDYRHQALSDRLTEDGTPMAVGQGSLLVRPDHEPGYQEVTVDAITLDDHIGSLAMPDATIAMWVDVEGALSQVLGGAAQTLLHTDVLMVEVETVRRWNEQRWLAGDVVEALAEAGLVAVARDVQSRHQHNIVFVRDSLLDDTDDTDVADMLRAFRRSDFGA